MQDFGCEASAQFLSNAANISTEPLALAGEAGAGQVILISAQGNLTEQPPVMFHVMFS
jgi:hypothetical protein